MRYMKLHLSIFILSFTTFLHAEGVCTPPPAVDAFLPACPAGSIKTTRTSVVSCYNPKLGFSNWSAAYVNMNNSHEFDRDTCDWKIDGNVKSISPSSYVNSGYVKGHLVAFTDVSCPSAAADTCTTTNIIPQPGAQNSGIWLALEKFIRKATSTRPSTSWMVIAGPRVSTPVEFIKPGLAKPNAIWKVLIDVSKNEGCAYSGAYLKPYVIRTVKMTDLGFDKVKDAPSELCEFAHLN